ncbi:MAG TPA: FKBP-type peptidyl-prolyl cis-trans isomerase [Bacteroidales bacterium]|nr:FKBP-type peptidyl-prolyl cis-trans isomerase [Bacteroidales bacterium]
MKQGKVVSLLYVLRAGNSQGEIIESVEENLPAQFILGIGSLIPDFESQIVNLKQGEGFEFIIPSERAYGAFDEQAVVNLPKSTFIYEGKELTHLLEVGNVIPMSDQDGNMINGKVLEVGFESVKVDFNHPLAGRDLHFKGTLLETRMATPEEMAHGHVHDDGCC